MPSLSLPLLLLLSLSFSFSFSSAELCAFQAGQFYPRSSVLSCFLSIPFDTMMRDQTLNTLQKTKELYTFLAAARSSPDPANLPLSVDLGKELLRLESVEYTSAYQFHDDIRSIYTSLCDAHAQYYLPTCFQNFQIRQVIPPTSYVRGKDNVIAVSRYMAADLVEHVREEEGLDITEYIGTEILRIDGLDADKYLQKYSEKNIGMSKDPGTRFHLAMVQPQPQPFFDVAASSYWQTRTKRNPFPEADEVTYEFLFPNGSRVTRSFAWTFKALKTYQNYDEFLADYWASPESIARQYEERKENIWRGSEEKLEPIGDLHPSTQRFSPFHTQSSPPAYTLLTNTTELYFYALNDSKTLVMYLDTMAPNSELKTYKTLNEGLTMAANLGLSRLVIDLTNNGGGDICFGQSLLAYFQGRHNNSVIWGPQDLILSELQENLTLSAAEMNVTNTVWSPAFYRDENGKHLSNTDVEAFNPGIPYERGGVERNYSTLLHLNDCGFWGYFISPEKDFDPDDVIILTHGFCGSTCAMVSSHAALYDGVRTFVAGGLKSRSRQQYFSFPGGQVLDAPEMFHEFDELGGDTSPAPPTEGEIIPRRLPTTASFRYCIREVYSPSIVTDPTTPSLEFSFQPATWKYDDSLETAEDPELLWYAVLPYFDQ